VSAVEGLRQRRRERDLPTGPIANAAVEGERLRRLSWASLEREALRWGMPVAQVSAAATRDELRLGILRLQAEAAA
jgi:hypothetical protein